MASTLLPSLTEAVCAMGRCAQLVSIDRQFFLAQFSRGIA